MNKKKAKDVLTKNAKISDFFSKSTNNETPTKAHDNKRKLSNASQSSESTILNSVTNLRSKDEWSMSPTCKKMKHDIENYIPVKDVQNVKEYNMSDDKLVNTPPDMCTKKSQLVKTPTNKKKLSPGKSSGKKTTPQRSKKGTPTKKIFEKSPRKLEEFNVQVLETFLQISPSTCNKIVRIKGTPDKSPVLIHNHNISPSLTNRGTPTRKDDTTPSKFPSQLSKNRTPTIRSKLKFSEDDSCAINHLNQKMTTNEVPSDLLKALDNVFDEEFNIELEKPNQINFNEPQFCEILKAERSAAQTLLRLKSLQTGYIGLCSIEEFWSSSNNFRVGDTVTVSAVQKTDGNWTVDNKAGWLVYEPNMLISCTSVVGSLFCKRKSVLSERFRGFDPGNRIMVIGVLIHTLLQSVLKEKSKTADAIEATLKNLLHSNDTVKRLYECNLTFQDVEPELLSFVPRIIEFVDQYVYGNSSMNQNAAQNWKGKICGIDDIEENILCPELGIKGKIDVTISTDLNNTMPLELKTGRATVSLEHRGQVMLYIMMMNKFGYKVSSGLLLYLREGVLREIKATPQEERDIMILRNELAYYLTRSSKQSNVNLMELPELPEPIVHHSACAKCAYNVICTSYLKSNNSDLSKNRALQEVQHNVTAHLTETHLNYFIHWSTLLNMEGGNNTGSKHLSEIYTLEPEKREEKGRSIINVQVVFVGTEFNNLVEHKFEKQGKETNLLTFGITENNYIVVSTDKRAGVACGFVTEISSTSISILLDRNLNNKYMGKTFHLDTYDTNITQTFNMTSLALLLDDTPRAAQLRNIIIDKIPPSFVTKLPSIVAKRGASILKRLNHVQQRAVLKALCAKDFFLIKGMPGTGKTATIVALVQLLSELNKTVLITSHTHSAIDNICLRLQKYGVSFMRLGSESRMNKNLRMHSEATLTKGCTTPEELQDIYNSFKVVAVTCLGSSHPLLSQRTFEFCIVDESTQVLQTSVIRPLRAAKVFVLIGDPDQLAPVVKNQDAVRAGMTETLFERLNISNDGIVNLNLNYRMNKVITDLANVLTYEGHLHPANDSVANKTLVIPHLDDVISSYQDHSWLLKALNTSLEASVRFIDTGPVWKFSDSNERFFRNSKFCPNLEPDNCVNFHEVALVVMLTNALIKGGVPVGDIGIIATFRAQVAQISSLLSHTHVDVSTVDQFQGRDKNVVIYSCTKSKNVSAPSSDIQKFELLEDKRRLTVAITRAKYKLLIVGDLSTLRSYSTFSKIFTAIKDNNVVSFDSSWEILNEVITS